MIASTSQIRSGVTTTVFVTSSLDSPTYYWYLDGAYVGFTAGASRTFILSPGDQVSVEAIDSTDPTFDPIANTPAAYPSRRAIEFFRTLSPVASYLVEQKAGTGAWTAIATIPDDGRTWRYQTLSARLADLTSYAWRVTARDAAGNSSAPVALAAETIVRIPDAPNFTATFEAGADQVLFAAA